MMSSTISSHPRSVFDVIIHFFFTADIVMPNAWQLYQTGTRISGTHPHFLILVHYEMFISLYPRRFLTCLIISSIIIMNIKGLRESPCHMPLSTFIDSVRKLLIFAYLLNHYFEILFWILV